MTGHVSYVQTMLEEADVVIYPPSNGFLWDLAWDWNIQCHDSNMETTSECADNASHDNATKFLSCLKTLSEELTRPDQCASEVEKGCEL